MCPWARIRGCSIDFCLFVGEECVYSTRVNQSENGSDQNQCQTGSTGWSGGLKGISKCHMMS